MLKKCECKNSKEVFNCNDKYRCDKNPILKGNDAKKFIAQHGAEKNLKERQRILNCPLLNQYNL
jgi:hypothetical protein